MTAGAVRPPIDTPSETVSGEAELPLSQADRGPVCGLVKMADLAEVLLSERARHPRPPKPDEVEDFVRTILLRLDAASILRGEPCERDLELGPYLRDLCGHLTTLHTWGDMDFLCDFRSDCRVGADEVTAICLIVGEIVLNSIKYAHPTGCRGRILVACERCEDDLLVVWVMDDGVGLPEGFDPSRDGGMGLRIVHRLSRQLAATCHFESTDLGLRFRLELPDRPEPAL
jgi:two-component sensor histidine kinase